MPGPVPGCRAGRAVRGPRGGVGVGHARARERERRFSAPGPTVGREGRGWLCGPSSWSPAHLPLSFQSQHFDGLVVEVWNQLLVQKHV